MIQPLTDSEMIQPYEVGKKLNELIEGYNQMAHKLNAIVPISYLDGKVEWFRESQLVAIKKPTV